MNKQLVCLLFVLLLAACGQDIEQTKTDGGSKTAESRTVQSDVEPPQVLAPGYAELTFDAPEPGSYELPPIAPAHDGTVLNEDGEAVQLHDLYDDKIVLLSFIYSTCTDLNGCPLATAVFHKIKNRLKDEKELADDLQMISLSFDPLNDTPEVMKLYGQGFQGDAIDWRFLTTDSEETLQPILDDYNQSIIRDYDEDGNPLGTISHILHVYLIDAEKKIRNIYSVSFLHTDILVADIKTLLMEQQANSLSEQPARKISRQD